MTYDYSRVLHYSADSNAALCEHTHRLYCIRGVQVQQEAEVVAMPLYDIKCDDCGWKWEHMMKSSDVDPCCPECGSAFTKRLASFPKGFNGLPTKKEVRIPTQPTKVWMGGRG